MSSFTDLSPETLLYDETLKAQLSPPQLIAELAEIHNDKSSETTTFQYAFALGHSSIASERCYGIALFDQLIATGYQHSQDCVYGQAVGYYLNGDTSNARRSAESILRKNGNHLKARELHLACIDKETKKERQNNLVVGSSVVAIGFGVAFGILGIVLGGKKR
jgi:hypothetical protein